MRYLCVSPNIANDEYVHAIKMQRIHFMQQAQVVNVDNVAEDMQVVNFVQGDSLVLESEILDGKWVGIREFNDTYLEFLRHALRQQIYDAEKDIVHVDLGKSLYVMYAAYFSILAGYYTNISFHIPQDTNTPFHIAGDTNYGNHRNNLRRFLATQVLKGAANVFVDDEKLVPVLNKLFPQVTRDILFDPLFTKVEDEVNV